MPHAPETISPAPQAEARARASYIGKNIDKIARQLQQNGSAFIPGLEIRQGGGYLTEPCQLRLDENKEFLFENLPRHDVSIVEFTFG